MLGSYNHSILDLEESLDFPSMSLPLPHEQTKVKGLAQAPNVKSKARIKN